MPARVRVAIATVKIARYPTFEAFDRHMQLLAGQAKTAGAELLLLPELLCVGLLWTCGTAAGTQIRGVATLYDEVLTPIFGDYQRLLSRLAVDSGLAICGASFWHGEDGRFRNSGLVFDRDGRVLRQDKLHPTRAERAIETSGAEALIAFELAGVKMGMAICYDIEFPEVARSLIDAGVEVILVPSLTDERGHRRVRYCAHARAIENQCFVCVSPLIGDLGIPVERPVRGHGAAFVACPVDNCFQITDGTYGEAEADREGLLHVELDLELLRRSRQRAEIRPLADRRHDLYASLKPEVCLGKQP